MLKVYDKAQWHIDAGDIEDNVIDRFEELFNFLAAKNFLTQDGKEILELGIDNSVSVHENMLNDLGNEFMNTYYDKVLELGNSDFSENLNNAYKEFVN